MVRADIVAYLRENLKKFPAEDLRQQLAQEGVGDNDFDDCLDAATKPQATTITARASAVLARMLMFAGFAAILVAAVLAVFQKPYSTPKTTTPATKPLTNASGFVGHSGYVIKLPPSYTAVQSFQDERKAIEIVHFCKTTTDPTNFLNEGLYGQLGIVKLVVSPSPVSDDLTGLEDLSALIKGRAEQRGEKFAIKSLQVSTLRGLQVTYEVPFARVEAYLLGRNVLYSFTTGQDNDIYQGLLQSLRDSRSEI